MNNIANVSQNITNLYSAILLNTSMDEITSFLNDLLSEDEVKEFANRWKVAKMLNDQVPYLDITLETGVSSATIARISKCLNRENSGYQTIINKIKN